VPERGTSWGLPPPLSVTCTLAVKVPVVRGVNVTVIVQVPCAGTEEQLFVWLKSLGSAPVIVTPLTESDWVPELFVRVMLCGELLSPTVTVPKLRLVGEKETTVPTPVSETVCGLFEALSVIVMVPVLVPVLVGLNATRIVQLPFGGATKFGDIGQLLVIGKIVLLLLVTLEMIKLPVPLFVTVTVC